MGYLRPTAIIVSGSYNVDLNPAGPHWIEAAHDKAASIFAARDLAHLITDPLPPATNGERSFLVAWDGSKEGWDTSDHGDLCREEFKAWLREQEYGDGSSPLDWVEVQYGGDDYEALILAHGDALRTEAEV